MAGMNPAEIWTEHMVGPRQDEEGGESADYMDMFGLAPWDEITEEQALLQWQRLQGIEAEVRPIVASLERFTDEEKDYLYSTPIEDMDREWQQFTLQAAGAIDDMERVYAAREGALEVYPTLAQHSSLTADRSAPAPPGVPMGGESMAPPGVPMGDESMAPPGVPMGDESMGLSLARTEGFDVQRYNEMMMRQLELNIEAQEKGLADHRGPSPFDTARDMMDFQSQMRGMQQDKTQWDWTQDDRDHYIQDTRGPIPTAMKGLSFMDYLRDRKWAKEDRERSIAAQQAALAHQAWQRGFQQRQLGAQVANNLGSLQQNAWQYIGQNALPAGTGHVPGFGPDSRLAGIMGPSFPGLPTVTLDTPDPRAPYAWAQRYAAGG